MEKINNLMLASLLMAFAFGVTSCNKDKDDDADVDSSKAIVGIWDNKKSESFVDGKTENDFFRDFYKDYYKENLTKWEETWGEIEDFNGDGVADYNDVAAVIDMWYEEDESEDDLLEAYLEFKADGNAKSYARYKDGDEDNFNCKYEISGNKLILTYEDNENYEGDEDEDVEEWEFSIKGNTLTITLEEEWVFSFDKKKHTRRQITTLTKR